MKGSTIPSKQMPGASSDTVVDRLDERTDGGAGEAPRLRRQLARARAANTVLETMIEDKTRSLFLAHQQLEASNRQLETLLTSVAAAVISTDGDGVMTSVRGRTEELVGTGADDLVGRAVGEVLNITERDGDESGDRTCDGSLAAADGRSIPVLVTRSGLVDGAGRPSGTVYTAIDVSAQKQLEAELRSAQRLESIGSLAAGVAHELNTPIQYSIHSVRFLADVVDDLLELDRASRRTWPLLASVDGGQRLIDDLAAREEALDLAFARREVPSAIERAIGGLQRVAKIVRALKQFSHPGDDVAPHDVNQVIETAVTLSRHEYKYVADVELDLAPVPPAWCNQVRLSQVLVNLLVNAAHAIEDRRRAAGEDPEATDGRGRITIASAVAPGGGIRIDVTDDGGGIPSGIRDRVFDPFFTTKDPGRGTGQGLALAYDTVVKGFGGRLTLDVVDGVGTTFHVWLREDGR